MLAPQSRLWHPPFLEMQKAPAEGACWMVGGGGGTRTRDLRFSRPALSRLFRAPLSYTPIRFRVFEHDVRPVSLKRRGESRFSDTLNKR